ncbi:hypothetical protein HMPREF2660_06150 [Weeksella sp. HMSC059D05]|nr:hypothetical protein HMPREF2660_06150 [Weeksella sp. HMSC059D05]
MLIMKTFYSINKLVDAFKENLTIGEQICVYTKPNVDEFVLGQEYWIDDYPDIDDDDNEVFPSGVIGNHLVYLYSGQQFADVIGNVSEQKATATLSDYVAALNYYNQHDTFMDFSS